MTKRQVQAKKTKDRIVRNALKILETKPLEKTTVKEICDASGISTGAFYHYFDSKERMMIERYVQVDQSLCQNRGECEAATMVERIGNCIDCYVETAIEDGHVVVSEVYRALLSLNEPFPRSEKQGIHLCLLRWIKEAQNTGELSSETDAHEMADELLILVRGVIFNWCQEEGGYPLAERTKKMISKYLKGYQ